jgi:hypothetical protein
VIGGIVGVLPGISGERLFPGQRGAMLNPQACAKVVAAFVMSDGRS